MKSAFSILPALLLVGLSCFNRPGFADEKTPKIPTVVMTGIATTPNGQPLAGAHLYLVDRPGHSSSMAYDVTPEEKQVVTNANGNFSWVIPKRLVDNYTGNEPFSKPECYALPMGTGWTDNTSTFDYRASDVLDRATLTCQTRWLATGNHPRLSVIAPEVGTVDMLVRDTAGIPLSNHRVDMVFPSTFDEKIVYHGQTDVAGHLRWQNYPSFGHLLLVVPSVGFGSTGNFELLPGKVTSLEIPPLAPFATISGTVAPELRELKTVVVSREPDNSNRDHNWYHQQATIDAQGHFLLEGLLPGPHTLSLDGGHRGSVPVALTTEPGQTISGVKFEPYLPKESPVATPERSRNPYLDTPSIVPITSISGHLADTNGQPLAGATIYALHSKSPSYDLRSTITILTAKTGPDGKFLIALPAPATDSESPPKAPTARVQNQNNGVFLLAKAPEHPLVIASYYRSARRPSATDQAPDDSPEVSFELMAPKEQPSLEVRVLKAGKPAAGALVRIKNQSTPSLYDFFFMSFNVIGDSTAMRSLLEPTAIADANGVAHFTDLSPGLWDITAVEGTDKDLNSINNTFDYDHLKKISIFNIVDNVAVHTGSPQRVTINIYPQPRTAHLRIVNSQGNPPPDASLSVNYRNTPEVVPQYSYSNFKVDQHGDSTLQFEHAGLWSLATHFRDIPAQSYPLDQEPYYGTNSVLAISTALPNSHSIEVHAVKHEPGTLRVQLQDKDGHPTVGAIWMGNGWDSAQYGASTSPSGQVVFPRVPSDSYMVRASFALANNPLPRPVSRDTLDAFGFAGGSFALPNFGKGNEPFPSDSGLTVVYFFRPQPVEVHADQETHVTLRPEPMGYIRGQIDAPDGPSHYQVGCDSDPNGLSTVRTNKETGEFVAGPFPAGPTKLYLSQVDSQSGNTSQPRGNFTVDVVAGKVTHTTLTPQMSPSTATNQFAEDNKEHHLLATVLLSDGKTPAWGAQADVMTPQYWGAVQQARTDAQGHIDSTSVWRADKTPANPPPGSPTEPVLVVSLPGNTGAAIVPYVPDQEEGNRIILPPAITLHGRVTVGHQSVAGLNSSFTVFAAFQGRGKLNWLLSVRTTANADGSFELSGLTPGTYQIQAARDGIWLSTTQQLVVATAPLPDYSLDITPPGVPVRIHVVDQKGKPLVEQPINLQRLAGPQTELLWPKTLATDGKGDLYLEGLETGQHRLRLPTEHGDTLVTFKIPALTSANSGQVKQLRITLPRPKTEPGNTNP